MKHKTYLCIDDWCNQCKGRIYCIGRHLDEYEYIQNNFIRNNPRIIIIGKECCDCGRKLTTIKQHVTCTDSEGDWWYQDVDTIYYQHNPSCGPRWYRCTACCKERDLKYITNQFTFLGLESGEVNICRCNGGFIRESENISINKQPIWEKDYSSKEPNSSFVKKIDREEENSERFLEF